MALDAKIATYKRLLAGEESRYGFNDIRGRWGRDRVGGKRENVKGEDEGEMMMRL